MLFFAPLAADSWLRRASRLALAAALAVAAALVLLPILHTAHAAERQPGADCAACQWAGSTPAVVSLEGAAAVEPGGPGAWSPEVPLAPPRAGERAREHLARGPPSLLA